jgi:Rod binding domain-containing protein
MIVNPSSTTSPVNSPDPQRHSKLVDAAQQFEGMLLQELLKPMRSGEDGWDEEKSDGTNDTLSSFGTEAVAKAISSRGGLGIARQIVQQLGEK